MKETGVQTDTSYNQSTADSNLILKHSRSHTVTILHVILLAIFILSQQYGQPSQLRLNLNVGLLSGILIFIVFAGLHFPDGIFVRPCLVLWRCVKAANVLYLVLLVFLLFQNLQDVRTALGFIEPATLQIYTEKSYAEGCVVYDESYTLNPYHNVTDRLDIFVIAHFAGWLFKALILRDWTLLWLCSFLFEISELIFRYILPNFYECWWDHLLLDVFGCNLFGMWLGMYLYRRMKLKAYAWGRPMTRSAMNIDMSPFLYFYPFNLIKFPNDFQSWFENEWTLLYLCLISTLVTVFDLNFFFLKAILKLEPGHWICLLRTMITALAAAPALSELQSFLEEGLSTTSDGASSNAATSGKKLHQRRLGVQAWLLLATLACEVLLILRWAPEEWKTAKQPWYSKLLLSMLVLVPLSILVGISGTGSQKKSNAKYN